MNTFRTRTVNQVFRIAVKSYRGHAHGFVQRFRLLTRIGSVGARLPQGVTMASARIAVVEGEWLVPERVRGTLLYLHGGAFVSGSPAM